MAEPVTEAGPKDELPDFGQQTFGYDDPHPWITPVIWGLAFGAFMLMLILGKAPWQT